MVLLIDGRVYKIKLAADRLGMSGSFKHEHFKDKLANSIYCICYKDEIWLSAFIKLIPNFTVNEVIAILINLANVCQI